MTPTDRIEEAPGAGPNRRAHRCAWWSAAARRASRRRSPRAARAAPSPSRALPLSRRPRLRRHGAGARRHAQRRRDHRAGHLHGDDRAHGKRRGRASIRRPRTGARAGTSTTNGRAGAPSTSARTLKPQPIVMRGGLRSGRLEAHLERDDRGGRRRTCGCTPGSRARSSRTARIQGVICETKAGREAILGDVVIDTTGDLDVAAAGRREVHRRQPTSSRPCSASAASTPTRPSASSDEEPEAFAQIDRAGEARHRRHRGTTGG